MAQMHVDGVGRYAQQGRHFLRLVTLARKSHHLKLLRRQQTLPSLTCLRGLARSARHLSGLDPLSPPKPWSLILTPRSCRQFLIPIPPQCPTCAMAARCCRCSIVSCDPAWGAASILLPCQLHKRRSLYIQCPWRAPKAIIMSGVDRRCPEMSPCHPPLGLLRSTLRIEYQRFACLAPAHDAPAPYQPNTASHLATRPYARFMSPLAPQGEGPGVRPSHHPSRTRKQ
jgi:hypothetical protein